MVHANAQVIPTGRRLSLEGIEEEGWSVAVATESTGDPEGYGWLYRY